MSNETQNRNIYGRSALKAPLKADESPPRSNEDPREDLRVARVEFATDDRV